MKKFLVLLMSLILCMTFTACVGEDYPQKESGTVIENSKNEEVTYGVGDTAVFKTLKFTATEIKETDGDGFFTPESGNVFVGINFTIENVSEEDQSVSSILLFEGYADDIKCDYSISAACAFDGTLDGTIAPGKKLVGWYALEAPENWSVIELQVQSDWLSNRQAKFVFNK